MKRLPAIPVFYALEFLLSMPSFIVIAIYLVQVAELGPLQLILGHGMSTCGSCA
jgi:hypothetical protein